MKLQRKILTGIMTFIMFTSVLYGAEPKKTEIKVVKLYDNKIPKNIKTDIKYKGDDLPELLDYIFIKTKYGNVRKFPTGSSPVIYQVPFNHKLQVLEKRSQKALQNLSGIKYKHQMA